MNAKGKLRIIESGYNAYCPGCKYYHPFDSRWTFNGDFDKPTFTPSMLVNAQFPESRCHSFIANGEWQFLNDCYHKPKGQVVVMQEEEED